DLSRVGRVADLEDPQRDAREEAPIRAREPLQVLGRPDPVELRARQGHVGALPGGHRLARLRLHLGLLHDAHARPRLAAALELAPRVRSDLHDRTVTGAEAQNTSSIGTCSPAGASPSPATTSA